LRWFQQAYQRGHHGKSLVRKIVNAYYNTRGSYRRTSDDIENKLGFMRVFRIIDALGRGCKGPVQVARELHPKWSGFLGLDSKVVKIHGDEWLILVAVDLDTEDMVDFWLVKHEDSITLSHFLVELRDEIHYDPKMVVIDLDPAWKEAVESVFPDVPIQFCVVHFERIVDRIIPRLKRTPKQMALKEMVRDVLYAESEEEARAAKERLLKKRGYFTERKSRHVISSLMENFELLITHFRVKGSFRSNNSTESVNDKLKMKLWLIRGYKRVETARNSLKLMVMHYRFRKFSSSCSVKAHNGKSPLQLAGVDVSKLDWITYSQKDPSILKVP